MTSIILCNKKNPKLLKMLQDNFRPTMIYGTLLENYKRIYTQGIKSSFAILWIKIKRKPDFFNRLLHGF